MTNQLMAELETSSQMGTPASVVDLIVAELRKHEPLLNQLAFPGTVLLHMNPCSEHCPITVHIDYKLPSQQK